MCEKVKKDLRIEKTYKLLCDALLELLKERAFEDIHVKDICEKAMVHRSTFYMHFEDKNHLLTYGLRDMINLITSLKTYGNNIEAANEIIKKVFIHVYDKHILYETLLYKCNSNIGGGILHNQVAYDFKEKLTCKSEAGEKSNLNLEVASQFYAGAIISVITWWLKNGMDMSTEEISKETLKLLYLNIVN